MPHLIIEYSSTAAHTVKESNIVEILHHAVMQCGLFKPQDIKTRAYEATDFHVGEKGRDGSFLHAIISLKPGRTSEQKQALVKTILDMLHAHTPTIDQVTVDLQELSEAYQKFAGNL